MFKSILVVIILASLTFVLGCGTDNSPQYATRVTADCGGGLCIGPDATEASGFCTGVINLTDQSGKTYSAQLPGYPLLSFPTFDFAEVPSFNVTISAPCADIMLEKMVFDVSVAGLDFSIKMPEFEVRYDGLIVGKISGFVSGDVSPKHDTVVEWTSAIVISKSIDRTNNFSLVCLNREAFTEKTSVVVCLRSIQWRIHEPVAYLMGKSDTYVMGTPDVCQTTQF